MANSRRLYLFLIFIHCFLLQDILHAQDWKFVKERDGIRIYTKDEPNTKLKSFKGEAYFHTTVSEVYPLFADPEDTDWWDEDVLELSLIQFEEDKLLHYYLVYDVPWPFNDRDLYIESFISRDSLTGKVTLLAESVDDVVAEKPELIRISRYWQLWTVEPATDGTVHLVLEGFVDAGGNIPAWLQNMLISSGPLKMFRKIRERVE